MVVCQGLSDGVQKQERAQHTRDSTTYMPLLGHGNITHLPLLEPLPSQPAAIARFQACLCSQLVQKRT